MLSSNSLGTARIAMLLEDLKSDLTTGLYGEVTTEMPRSMVTAKKGKIFYIPGEQRRANGQRSSGPIAENADTPTRETELADRDYVIRRFADGRIYSKSLEGDALFAMVKDQLLPMTVEQVTFDVDSVLFTILSGAGTEADSRNVLTSNQASAKFDNDATDVLGILSEGVEKTGANFAYVSTDVARKMAKQAQIKEQSRSGIAARQTMGLLVDILLEHLMLDSIVIGNRHYQNGSSYQTYNLATAGDGIFYIGRRENLIRVPWDDLYAREYEDESKEIITIASTTRLDLVTGDPSHSLAYLNVLT